VTPLTYSVVGLGKLGACMAAAIASRGFTAIGVDLRQEVVDAVNDGRAPVPEPELAEMIAANRARLRATTSYEEAIHASEVTFVIVPTPSEPSGAFSLSYAAAAFERVGLALRHKPGYHLVVLTSTVLPGATRQTLLPLLEAGSRKRCGPDFGLCYSPEFIALGSVIRDFLNPDLTLIGEFDERAGGLLESCYEAIVLNGATSRRMTLENAELTKISLNSYVTMKITFANMLAELCERIAGGDVDSVTRALGLDRRIGATYLRGALGYGGPCFPRDNAALAHFAESHGVDAALARTTDRKNRALAPHLLARLGVAVGPSTTVALLGLAYKPHTPVTEESQAMHLASALQARGARVLAHDPMADAMSPRELQGVTVDTLANCLRAADIVIVTTPDAAYHGLDAAALLGGGKTVTVIDCWRVLSPALAAEPRLRYIALGRGGVPVAS
jgi:UDPglucose 6-dehydrogenase